MLHAATKLLVQTLQGRQAQGTVQHPRLEPRTLPTVTPRMIEQLKMLLLRSTGDRCLRRGRARSRIHHQSHGQRAETCPL